MARPERRDADYFPFYCRDGKTLFILEGKYGCKGTGFFTNVMRFLTLKTDHHVCIREDSDRIYFFSKMKCDEESGLDMLNLMAMTGKIDKALWDGVRVIASQDLLDSLKDAYRQRRNPIITIEQIRVNHAVNEQNNDENTQEEEYPSGLNHKGKERKGKERKEGEPDGFTAPSFEDISILSDPALKENIKKASERLYQEKAFPEVHAFVNKMIKSKKNPRAILHTLARCLVSRPEDPWAYCVKIISNEHMTYNAKDYERGA